MEKYEEGKEAIIKARRREKEYLEKVGRKLEEEARKAEETQEKKRR